ncbi:MAG: AAA family ATPase [Candidatus Bathyarchaeia archaeon]
MIEELILENFKSFGERQTIRFMRGLNKISGRNAAGKTTILEAILFSLFGDVPGVNRQDLVSLRGGTLVVTLKFRSPLTGQHATIRRSGSLDKAGRFVGKELVMEVEGEEDLLTRERDVSRKVKELLGVGKRTFFNVVYAKQKEFVEILNPVRGRMDAILGLTTPVEIKEQLKDVKKSLESEGQIDQKGAFSERLKNTLDRQAEEEERIGLLDREIDVLKERIEELGRGVEEREEEMKRLEELAVAFEEVEKKRLRLEVLEGRQRDREKDLQEFYSKVGEEPEIRLAELVGRRVKSVELEERLQSILEKQLEVERRGLDGEISSLNHRIKEHAELKELGVAVCPKCGQEIDFERLEGDLEADRGELDEKSFRLGDLEKEIGAVKQQIESARGKRIDAERLIARFHSEMEQVEKLRKAMADLLEEYRSLQGELVAAEEKLKGRAEELFGKGFASLSEARVYLQERRTREQREWSTLQGELKSSRALIGDRLRRKGEAERSVEEYRRLVEETRRVLASIMEFEARIRVVERMEQRYTEYEKRIRKSILGWLEDLTFKYFQRLTDQQLYNRCVIDPENYSLQVLPIPSPGERTRPIPAWRCGGGHESLFALSERLALLRVMGFLHLLVLDEPTDAVDSENIPSLLEYISKSTGDIGQIILVTHHGYGEEERVNNILVRKVGGESRIQQGL